jgi:perosamine synthetase
LSGTVGHMGVWSFNFKKHLRGATEGGMILTDDPELATAARKFGGIGYKTLGPAGGSINFGRRDVQNPNFERFDAIGLNYRMSEISAAVCLAQVERADDLVARRKIIGRMYLDAFQGVDWMVPQQVPDEYVHTYYSCAFDYRAAEMRDVPWQSFYDRFMDLGGDGFYAELQCPYNEPAMRDLEIDGRRVYPGSCPVAEDLQPRLMKFKTSYRDMGQAQRMTDLLHQVAVEVESGAFSTPRTIAAG